MLQVFIALIVIAFMVLFAIMSLPMIREQQPKGEKSKNQSQNKSQTNV